MLRAKLAELLLFYIVYIGYIVFNVLIISKMKNRKYVALFIIISLTVFAGIRYNVGSDYDTYYSQYNNVLYYFKNVEDILSRDIQNGFWMLCYLTKKYWGYEFGIFWIAAIIIYTIYIFFLKQESVDFNNSIIFYFWSELHLASLNLLKQNISMAFFCKFYQAIKEKKYLKIILYGLCMIFFHFSSIIAIVVLVIAKRIKPTFRKLLYTLLGSVVLLFTYDTLVYKIPLLSRYQRYLTNINNEYFIVKIGAVLYLIYSLIVLVIILNYKDWLIQIRPENEWIISMLILAIPFKVLAIVNFPVFRISLYFEQFLTLLVPQLLQIEKKRKKGSFSRKYLAYNFTMLCWLIIITVFIPHNNFYSFNTIFNY